MTETILLICSLIVIVPVLMVAIGIYNLNRTFRGLEPLSGPDALNNMIRELLSSFKKKRTKSKSDVKIKQTNVEDAEFREK